VSKQSSQGIDDSAGPYPTFNGLPGPPSQAPISAQTTGQRPLAGSNTGSSLPPLTAADRTKFTRIFVGCGPHNGLVAGDKARDVFVKSQLSYDKLGLIWYVEKRDAYRLRTDR
jgi:epidermal growth factor receptor substrate 15